MSARVPSNAPQGAAVVDLRILARRGEERDRLLALADEELDAIADELVRVERAGGKVNVSLAARLAGVARDTIYSRLAARRIITENTNGKVTP